MSVALLPLEAETSTSVHPFWLSAASYWTPPRIVTSAWLEHAPFAYWLVDALRPRRVIELGTHFGFSFFVICEAAKRLGLPTEVYALDSWEGDHQAGFYDDQVFESVVETVTADYPDQGHTVRGYFGDSRPKFADDSVDLLHIDGRHRYEDVRQDFETWRSTVRDGGAILFHDTEERGGDFGVWRLWAELRDQNPSFSFTHGHGLGIIGVGEVPDPVTALFDADRRETDIIRSAYEALGAKVTRQAEFEAMPAEIDSLHEVVSSIVTENERLNRVILERDAAIQQQDALTRQILSSTSWRLSKPLRLVGSLLHRIRH